ncbi:MAG: PHB depolymerase family esterase, partial [Rhodocyclaceae bacterium]
YNIQNAEMADEGFAFIPTKCESLESIKNVACSVHFVLHGCNQNLEISGDKFIYQTGVWRYADKYNLIVVYPITKTSAKNPFGCWDWFGYTGENYATKLAPQLQTFDAISKELQSK